MLSLDFAKMPDSELERALAERCSRFGSVVTVAIFRMGGQGSPFALVDMAAPNEVQRVVQEVGDLMFGGSALIKLQQAPSEAGGVPTPSL
jgi:hypothetical protein